MDALGSTQASSQQQQLASMIRPDQFPLLPHLTAQMKEQQEPIIQKLWDSLRRNPQGSPEYQKAYANLAQVSNTLMAGMKRFNAQRHQRQQGLATQQAAPSNSAEVNRPAGLGIQTNQILPHIQSKVNSYLFALPPTMAEGSPTAETWLREARNRLAQAMQRAELAQKKMVEIQRDAHARNQSGNPLTQQEQEGLQTKIDQCNKVLTESRSFMKQFKDQQNTFRISAQQQRYEAQNPANTAQSENTTQGEPTIQIGQPTQQGGPQAHSISSAVSAARDQATNLPSIPPGSMSPTNTQLQPLQTPVGQQSQPPSNSHSAMSQSQQNGGPSPFTAQSIFQQPSSSYAQSQPQSETHAHPHQSAGFMNAAKKEERIPRNINITAPRPVPMPPARPTLNGGPDVGMPGQMGQPAIPRMPGYVLESSENGGGVLSNEKLKRLARDVCGPGEENQLTPEAEEVGRPLQSPLPNVLFSPPPAGQT